MLFNSSVFLFGFLPVTVGTFVALLRLGHAETALRFVVLASLGFYGWWDIRFLPVLLLSIGANFALGTLIGRSMPGSAHRRDLARIGVAANLALLGVCKYSGFLAANLRVLGLETGWADFALPIGISFFTFQQIAYLVDAARHPGGDPGRPGLWHYTLFIAFFPHLIAGPLTHHGAMLAQFRAFCARRYDAASLTTGSTLFIFALAKKVLLADNLANIAEPVFAAAARGEAMSASVAWSGAIGYALQLYFDFSAYSEMAIGLGLMFGIRLPVNFRRPYCAGSITQFWRCWHITLSAFLRDYLYIPLGGGRGGPMRRWANLLATMLLGGLWHGAGWTFVAWGGLHGLFLIINHAWRERAPTRPRWIPMALARPAGVVLTFTCVTIGWVFFRATSLNAAGWLLGAMAGSRGSVPADTPVLVGLAAGLAVVWFCPSLLSLFDYDGDRTVPGRALSSKLLGWRPSLAWGACAGVALALALARLPEPSLFLYFSF